MFYPLYFEGTRAFWRSTLPKTQEAGLTRHLSLAARLTVAVVAIVWVLHGQDWAKLGQVFRQMSIWYFLLSLATFTVAQVVIAFRWWLLLRSQGVHIAVRTAVGLFFLGLFYNNVMPGSVGGDLLKAWYITKHTEKRLAGALSVVVDRVIGLVGLVVMAAVAYLLFSHGSLGSSTQAQPGRGESWLGRYGSLVVWIALGTLLALAIVLAQPYGRARIWGAIRRACHRGIGLLAGVKDALALYCSKPLTLFWATVLTFIGQSIVIVAFWLLGRNLGITAGLTQYFVIFPVIWVVGAIPISVAGLGVVEGGTVFLFARLAGAPGERSFVLALALCQRFIWVLASLPGAAVHLLGTHLPREICLDGDKHDS
jgi:uncharacterized membrane protein YbhN (UPF0104 family)